MADYDYVVIGSGAGGGPLAANLARAGFKVCLMDAGGDIVEEKENETSRLMYEVPIFHGLCTEFEGCKWDYFVDHFADAALQHTDSKYDKEGRGIWYPRAGALGGCTAHNAMITVTPQAMDWDGIAQETGDWSWRAEKMYEYFARLENCHYVARPGSVGYVVKGLLWSALGLLRNRPDWKDWAHGHGFDGWLTTSQTSPFLILKDRSLVRTLLKTIATVFDRRVGSFFPRLLTKLDPNDLRNSEDSPEGLALTPLTVRNGKRNGPRDYLIDTQRQHPNLEFQLHSLVTRILFEGKKAIGVEFIKRPHLYRADPLSDQKLNWKDLKKETIRAGREVILSAGAFNSPQLLKLSGVGPAAELRSHGIDVVVDLPGVGENLQDRYEIGVISDYSKPFSLLEGALFRPSQPGDPPDPFFDSWKSGKGLYTSNGALIGIMKRSTPEVPEPDLYMFALPGYFKGYYRGYSQEFEHFRNRLTWVVLKAYTNNRAGRVTLRSGDPTATPKVTFHSFREGTDEMGDDIRALLEGVHFVRDINRRIGDDIARELWPGKECASDDQLRKFIEREAWGHHASCTNKIGAKGDPLAVLDGRFRVRGTDCLRVVDASVFPRIPGYFIVSAIYMISEKAFDAIKEDA